MNELAATIQYIVVQTQHNLYLLLLMIAVLFLVLVVTKLTGNRLLVLGIYPRHFLGLFGIIFAPMLHANFNHVFFNAIPLFFLGDFILLFGDVMFLKITVCITLLSGSMIWLMGRKAIHIGASSLITGYWGFLIMNVYHQGSLMAILLGIICIYYFAGIFFSIFPTQKGVSWEGHLFGLIAGVLTNYLLIS